MIKTFKVMLVPNNKQRTKLFRYAGVARFTYNWALAKQMESLQDGNGFISDSDLRKEFTKLRNSPEYPWLREVSNNVSKQAIKDLCGAYRRFFKMRKQKGYKPYSKKFLAHMKRIDKTPTFYQSNGHPKFKKKKDVTRYGFYQDNIKISFTETHVRLEGFADSKKKNRQVLNYVRLAEKNRIPVNSAYYNPRVTYDGINWWISVSIEMPDDNVISERNDQGVGTDLGIKNTMVCSDGTKYSNINKTVKIRKLEKRKRRLQRSISRKYMKNKKGESYEKTRNIIKAERELLKLNHRLTNIRHNYNNQMTSEVISRKPMFITLEDLNISGMMKNKYLSKSIQDQNLREIRWQIEYKAGFYNIPVFVADRYFPSSKMCNRCKKVKNDLKLSERTFRCECGYVADRDVNASYNLRDYGYERYVLNHM